MFGRQLQGAVDQDDSAAVGQAGGDRFGRRDLDACWWRRDRGRRGQHPRHLGRDELGGGGGHPPVAAVHQAHVPGDRLDVAG